MGEPSNREAREQLTKVKERLKALKQLEKERYQSGIAGGGLYKEQHAKLAKQQTCYEEEVARRKEAGEDEITFEEWQKKQKDKEEDDKRKEKDEREQRDKERRKEEEAAALELEKKEFEAENEKRKSEGIEELTLEDWRKSKRIKEDVLNTAEIELDEDEKKMLEEQKKKGYYHGRLGTVLSMDAPKPEQIERQVSPTGAGDGRSKWNEAGTWEEKDSSAWAKEQLKKYLGLANVPADTVALDSGETLSVTATVSTVKSVTGEAQIVCVRNKQKHGFNFECEMSFHISFRPLELQENGEPKDAETVKGTIRLPEVADFVDLNDLAFSQSWRVSPPEKFRSASDKWAQKLREEIRVQIGCFVDEYKKRS